MPTLPSGAIIEKKGVAVKDMTKQLVKTIEEMTLHSIQQQKNIDARQLLIDNLQARIEKLENSTSQNNSPMYNNSKF